MQLKLYRSKKLITFTKQKGKCESDDDEYFNDDNIFEDDKGENNLIYLLEKKIRS